MPRIHWLYWLLIFAVLIGFSALIGGCTQGRTVAVGAVRSGGVTTFTTFANAQPEAAVPAAAGNATLNLIRKDDTVEVSGFSGADADFNGTLTVTGPGPAAVFTGGGAPVGAFTAAQAGPNRTSAKTGTVTVPRPVGMRVLEAMALGLFGGLLSWGFVWGLLALGGYRAWPGFAICALFMLSPLWIVLELVWWIVARCAGRTWRFHTTPLAMVLTALLTGWFAGTMDGTWQVRTWNVLWQMPLEHTWGLSGTSISTVLKVLWLNGSGEHVKGEYSAAMSIAGRHDLHQYVNGFAIAKQAVFTQGCTMSNQQGIRLSGSVNGSGKDNPLVTHEQQHMIQNRAFGPLFTPLYLGWMGVTLTPSVLAGAGGGDVAAGINAWTYADNPFEVWGYTTGGSPTGLVDPGSLHPALNGELLWASPAGGGAATWTVGAVSFFTMLLLFGFTALAIWARTAWGTTQAQWWTIFGEAGGCGIMRNLFLALNLALNLGLTIALTLVSPGLGVVAAIGTVLALLACIAPAAQHPVGQACIGFANLLAPSSLFATLLGIVGMVVGLLLGGLAWLITQLARLRPSEGRTVYDPQGFLGSNNLPPGLEIAPERPVPLVELFGISGMSAGIAPLRLVVIGTFIARLDPSGVSLGPFTFINPQRLSSDGAVRVGDERFFAGLALGNAAFGCWQFLRFFDRPQPRPWETFWDLIAESAVPERARSTASFAQEQDRPRLPQWSDASGDTFVDHALVGGVLFCIAWLILILSFSTWGWPGTPDVCVPEKDCYCEKHPDLVGTLPAGSVWTGTGYGLSGIKQPSNTWSDLSYLIVGLIVLWQAGRDKRRSLTVDDGPNPMRKFSFYSISYGFVALYLGIGSMLFHASLTSWGGWADSFSLYVWASWLIAYDCARLSRLWEKGWEWIVFLSVFGTLALVTGIIRAYVPSASLILFVIPVVIMVITMVWLINFGQMSGLARETRANATWVGAWTSWLWPGVGVFLGSLAVWKLSADKGPLCQPDSYIQGHAVFHVGGAYAAYAIWMNLRSETASENPDRLTVGGWFKAFGIDCGIGLLQTLARLPQLIVYALIPFALYMDLREGFGFSSIMGALNILIWCVVAPLMITGFIWTSRSRQ